MIRFDLLGEIRLRAADGTPVDAILRQPKRLALLAYLVTPAPGSWHRRDILLALFWPELDTARARSSLRNALYVLRQILGDGVLRTRGDEEVSVDPARVGTDLAAVWQALRDGRGGDALAHCRGELLPGLFPPGSEGFQQWLEEERARLKVQVARAGLAWAATLDREGRRTDALAAVRRVLEINPDDETAVRQLMMLHEALGDRAGGLTVYEGHRRRLARSFDAAPAPETEALAARLRRAAGTSPAPGPADLPVEAVAPAPGVSVDGPRPRGTRWWLRALAAAAALAVVALVAWAAAGPPRPLAIGSSLPVTADEGLQIEPALSPNGRLVAYARGTPLRMRIYVQRLDGGQPWPLSGDTSAVELLPRWAPDNDQILFLARNGAWVSPAVGGSERLVVPGGEGDAMVRSASWSPNGDSVLIVRNDSLTVHPLDGVGSRFVGTGTQLHSCVWATRRPWIACVSGNWVAFTPGPLFGNRAPSSVVLFPSRGGRAIDLTDRDHEYESPAWSADGRFLWVLSNRDGVSGDVYAIPIGRDGRSSRPHVRMGLNAEFISLSSDRIAYSVPVRTANIWALRVPARPPVTLADAVPLTTGNQLIEVPGTSRDGEWLIYDSNLRGNADIYRIPVDGGAPARLTDDPRPEFGGALSPGGTELAYHMWVAGERRPFTKHLESGAVAQVTDGPGDWGVPRWSPDGRSLAIWSHETEAGAIAVTHRDSVGGWRAPAWTLAGAQLPVWSPDGGTIAFVQLAGSIGLIPADSGATRIIYAPRAASRDPLATFLAWSRPDHLWFLGHEPAGRVGIWELAISGGAPRQLVDFGGRTSGPALATDGRRLFFTLDQRMSNIRWAELQGR